MKCKKCGNENDLMVEFTNDGLCGKCTQANHKKAVAKVSKKYPSVPEAVFDIEASDEMAMAWGDMFGL